MNIVFIDIEANQFPYESSSNNDYILQIAAIKVNEKYEIIDQFFEECKHPYPIKKRILFLMRLHNNKNYFKKRIHKEEDIYQSFLDFCEGCEIYTYGDYDQKILDSVANRYQLKTIELIDYSLHIKQNLKIKNDNFSLRTLCFAMCIQSQERHDALTDAKLLLKVFIKMQEIKDNNLNKQLIKNLKNEKYRPYLYLDNYKKQYQINKVKDDYKIIFLNVKTLTKFTKIKKIVNDEEIIKKIPNYSTNVIMTIYDQKGKVLEKKINKTFEGSKRKSKNEQYELLKNDIKKYIKNAVFITNTVNNKLFIDYDNEIFNVNYRIAIKHFNDSKLNIQRFVKKINEFYQDGDFNKNIEYKL